MCNLGEGIREKALAEGMERGFQALVESLKDALPTFDDVYKAVIKNDIYKDVTEEQVRKYY